MTIPVRNINLWIHIWICIWCKFQRNRRFEDLSLIHLDVFIPAKFALWYFHRHVILSWIVGNYAWRLFWFNIINELLFCHCFLFNIEYPLWRHNFLSSIKNFNKKLLKLFNISLGTSQLRNHCLLCKNVISLDILVNKFWVVALLKLQIYLGHCAIIYPSPFF